MLLAFTDESYSENRYFQAAFIVRLDQLANLNDLINEAKDYAASIGIPHEVELHGHAIMNNRDGWEPFAGKLKLKLDFYRMCLRKISRIGGVIIIQGVDLNAMKEKYLNPFPPEEESHKHLLDAIDRYAKSNNEVVVIYSDEAPQQKRLGELFQEYKVTSTGGNYPRHLKNIIRVEYIDSRDHYGIQIADLAVYLYRRMEDHFKENEVEKFRLRKMWAILETCIHPWFPPRIWP